MTNIVDTIFTVADAERVARGMLPTDLFGFMFGKSDDSVGRTDAANVRAFDAAILRPRVLAGVAELDTSTTLLGSETTLPLMLAPVGAQSRVHPEGELAAVRAAGEAGIIMVASTVSSFSIEEITEEASSPVWFQLYFFKDRGLTQHLIQRAERAACKALVLTVDYQGALSNERAHARPNIGRYTFGNFRDMNAANSPNWANLVESLDMSLNWRDIEWMRKRTTLPIVLKGVQTAEDTALARQHGVEALIVSNHGGHALATMGTLHSLPQVVAAAEGHVEVYLDGGIRTGSDVLKALAFGARAVLIGRAQFWGLTIDGQRGLHRVLDILKHELETTMSLCGVKHARAADRRLVAELTEAPGPYRR